LFLCPLDPGERCLDEYPEVVSGHHRELIGLAVPYPAGTGTGAI
jgi:hypothetical protein